jgi:hypothetical protein
VNLTALVHLGPRLIMSGALPPPHKLPRRAEAQGQLTCAITPRYVLKVDGNYMYHFLQQSVITYFVLVGFL